MQTWISGCVLFLGVVLAGCSTPNESFCERPSDCLANQTCVEKTCQDLPMDAGVGDGTFTTIDAGPPPVAAAEVSLDIGAIKLFAFSWADVPDATHYKLLEKADSASEFVQVDEDVAMDMESLDLVVPLFLRVNAEYILQSCNDGGCVDSDPVAVTGNLQEAIGYVKGEVNTDPKQFGYAVALSGDGNTLAVGTSFSTQVYSEERVYIYQRTGAAWTLATYVVASNNELLDFFGASLALSADGNTLAVGAGGEGSSATGVGGTQANNAAFQAGAVYIFSRSGTAWSQQAYLKASNTDAGDGFGNSVAISGDGDTLVVGARSEDSSATGIGGVESSDSSNGAGAAYLFRRNGSVWAQQEYLKASNTGAGDNFGGSVAISADGNTVVAGGPFEDDQHGAAYVFGWDGAEWTQQAYLSTGVASSQYFGASSALSANGSTLAVGGPRSDGLDRGEVRVFARVGTSWSEQQRLQASNADSGYNFGNAVSLSADGETLAVGALYERSSAIALAGDETNRSGSGAGAAYVFTRDQSTWTQQVYVKASNTGNNDAFGSALTLSGDGQTMAIGAPEEDSNATGFGGDQNDNSSFNTGAVYLY